MLSNLFGFHGRINRAQYWLGALLIFVFGMVVLGVTFGMGGAALMSAEKPAQVLGSLGLMFALLIPLIVVMCWMNLALQVKRFHDRGKTGWFAALPIGLSALGTFASLATLIGGASGLAVLAAAQPFNMINLLVGLWFFIELGFLPGDDGPNKFDATPGVPGMGAPSKARTDAPIPGASLGGVESAMARAIAQQASMPQLAPVAVRPAPSASGSATPSFGRRTTR